MRRMKPVVIAALFAAVAAVTAQAADHWFGRKAPRRARPGWTSAWDTARTCYTRAGSSSRKAA